MKQKNPIKSKQFSAANIYIVFIQAALMLFVSENQHILQKGCHTLADRRFFSWILVSQLNLRETLKLDP